MDIPSVLVGVVVGAVLGAIAMLLIAKNNPKEAAAATVDVATVIAHAKALTADLPGGTLVHIVSGASEAKIATPIPDSVAASSSEKTA